jgi:CubicO group peptidase (beta-lactamase class C family)
MYYQDAVSKHWPEFIQFNKSKITIETVMRQEAGLDKLSQQIQIEDTWPENIKNNAIGQILESSKSI